MKTFRLVPVLLDIPEILYFEHIFCFCHYKIQLAHLKFLLSYNQPFLKKSLITFIQQLHKETKICTLAENRMHFKDIC